MTREESEMLHDIIIDLRRALSSEDMEGIANIVSRLYDMWA